MNMTKKIDAICISCTNEDDVLTVAVGDDYNDPKNYFIIGRFDEDDLTVDECIGFQSDSTEYEIADAIEKVELDDENLIVYLNDNAALKAGAKQYLVVLKNAKEINNLKHFLKKIFEDSSIDIIIKN